MTLVQGLKRARALIAGGWSEPFSLDARGVQVPFDAEEVAKFTVVDALCVAQVLPEGWVALEDVARPAHAYFRELTHAAWLRTAARAALVEGADLQQWIQTPGRKLAEVLRIFDVAILRASRKDG
jgi:hypothetical protein